LVNSFDYAIISFLNGFARRSWTFDATVVLLTGNNLLKGGVVVAFLWSAWSRLETEDIGSVRNYDPMLNTFLSCFIAMFTARTLALVLPFRPRPLYVPELGLRISYELGPRIAETWSSFPSDHASLFFCLAAGIFFMSRGLGMLALAYVFGFIALPKVYLGLHYPTDIIAGALVGVLSSHGVHSSLKIKTFIHERTMVLHRKSPGVFYAGFFLLSYQIADLFDEVRSIANFAFSVLQAILRRMAS
jgi:undecaprenyl-diphosphatase